MKYGVCIGIDSPEQLRIAAQCGYDYVETNFTSLTQADEAAYTAFSQALQEAGVPCEAANCFIPGTLPLTGGSVDFDALRAFVEKGMQRARAIGIEVVVFGSGGARKLTEGVSYREGFLQLAAFLREIAGPIAQRYGVRIAIEPLCPQECNIINRVKEGVMLAAASGCDNVGGLGDLYHMAIVGEGGDEIRQLHGSILHTHIANPALGTERQRWYPADPAEYDYADFIRAAEAAGCPRCSVEGRCSDFAREAPLAVRTLHRI